MPRPLFQPDAQLWTVNADESIAGCVRIMREHSVGALVVLSTDHLGTIVGIFTERDLVKSLELIERGAFWETPVRAVMTSKVVTVAVEKLATAPKLMALRQIRHLPVVAREGKRVRLVGVISMRDIFRYAMEAASFDLARVYAPAAEARARKRPIMAIISADQSLLQLVDQSLRLTKQMVVKAAPLHTDFSTLPELLERFDAVFVDLDDLEPAQCSRALASARAIGRGQKLYLGFNPTKLSDSSRASLKTIANRGRAHLLAKPLNLGLLYEKLHRE